MRTATAVVIFFVFVQACSKSPTSQGEENSQGLTAITDKLSYTLTNGLAQVQFWIENGSDSTAWFPHCAERFVTIVNRLENGNWEDYGGWGWPCLAIYSMGTNPLMPDSIYFDFFNFNRGGGDYRFSFLYRWDESAQTWYDTLYSNEFTVR